MLTVNCLFEAASAGKNHVDAWINVFRFDLYSALLC